MRIAAILYLHDISNDDSESVVDRSIAVFLKLCGEDAMDQIAFVTTKWDRCRDSRELLDRVKELDIRYWQNRGVSVFHVQPSSWDDLISPEHKKPWDILYQILLSADKRDPDRILKIRDGIVIKKQSVAREQIRWKPGVDLKKLLQRLKEVYRFMVD